MTKVYIVIEGESWAPRIAGVYSTRNKAMEHISRYDEARLARAELGEIPPPGPEEFDVDPPPPAKPQIYWRADIDLLTGKFNSLLENATQLDRQQAIQDESQILSYVNYQNAPISAVGFSYQSYERACELAVAERQRWLEAQQT